MIPERTQARSHRKNTSNLKNQQGNNIYNDGRSIRLANKPVGSINVKTSSQNYNALHAVTTKHTKFCEEQMTVAYNDQSSVNNQKELYKDKDFEIICSNRLQQIKLDINYIYIINGYFGTLIEILNKDKIDFDVLSDYCIPLVLELHKKIEYLKTALQVVLGSTNQRVPADCLSALYINNSQEISVGNGKYSHAVCNIKTLLGMQKDYLPYISINRISEPQQCYFLAHASLNHHESSSAIEYFKRGISLYPMRDKSYYEYLGQIESFLRSNFDPSRDIDLALFFNSVATTYHSYLEKQNGTDSASLD